MNNWHWEVQGRYGYWAVDRYDEAPDRATYGHSLIFTTKKQATEVANELNWAFREGKRS